MCKEGGTIPVTGSRVAGGRGARSVGAGACSHVGQGRCGGTEGRFLRGPCHLPTPPAHLNGFRLASSLRLKPLTRTGTRQARQDTAGSVGGRCGLRTRAQNRRRDAAGGPRVPAHGPSKQVPDAPNQTSGRFRGRGSPTVLPPAMTNGGRLGHGRACGAASRSRPRPPSCLPFRFSDLETVPR